MKLALGVFDGVHRGHQKIIEKAHRVITFDPHPNRGVHLLTTLAERKDLIGNLEVIKFTDRIANMYPQDFIEGIVVKKFKPEALVVGHDFAFGYNRSGNSALLIELGKKYKFEVEIVSEVDIDGLPVRSSAIRRFLAAHDIEEANKFLGRDYMLSGKVIHGSNRGTGLGFPTLNIEPEGNKLIPGEGIYKGEVIIRNKLYAAAIFIGERQTFNEHQRVIEAHILDFSGDIYDETVTIFFQRFIREERKFADAEALQRQIRKDIELIKTWTKPLK